MNANNSDFENDVSPAIQIVRDAGKLLVDRFDGKKQVSYKGRNDLVTDVDELVEEQIIRSLRNAFPGCGIVAEESDPIATETDMTWIIDPLDGTSNYVNGIPFFAVNLALMIGNEVVLGITLDPMRNELFHAVKSRQAYLNQKLIKVSSKKKLEGALIGYDLGYSDEKAKTAIEMILHLWSSIRSTRMMGSAALGLAYVACGRTDLYFHHHLSQWDLAAALVIVSEAKGVTSDRQGQPASLLSTNIIAANRSLHSDFLSKTREATWRIH